MKIEPMPGSHLDLRTMMAMVAEQYPNAANGIIAVFDRGGDGELHIHWCCRDQEMALAAARMMLLAAGNK